MIIQGIKQEQGKEKEQGKNLAQRMMQMHRYSNGQISLMDFKQPIG